MPTFIAHNAFDADDILDNETARDTFDRLVVDYADADPLIPFDPDDVTYVSHVIEPDHSVTVTYESPVQLDIEPSDD